MKKVFTAACLALGMASMAQAAPADEVARVVKTRDFIAACTNKNSSVERAFCHGFGQGVYDTYVMSRHQRYRPDFICFGDQTINRKQTLENFAKWVDDHPQYLDYSAADTLLRYLAKTYPCENTGKKARPSKRRS